MYARGAGKNGKHNGVLDGAKSISALSYIGVKLYRIDSASGVFTSVTEQMELLGCATFAHVPSVQVLVKVKSPTVASNGQVALNDGDFHLFSQFRASCHSISNAIQSPRSKKKKKKQEDDQEDDD